MQIHELNNFTGTLGSGSFLAVDNGTDTGKVSTQQILASVNARIDNIIAGEAPSAEEIVDARLGDDGVVYPSLGDAIRDQFSDVKSETIKSSGVFDTGTYSNLGAVKANSMIFVPTSISSQLPDAPYTDRNFTLISCGFAAPPQAQYGGGVQLVIETAISTSFEDGQKLETEMKELIENDSSYVSKLEEVPVIGDLDSFTNLLRGIQMNTSINIRVVKVLISLNYFRKYGKCGKLMKVYDEFVEGENAPSKTVKSFKERLDKIREFEASLPDESLPISLRLKEEYDNIGLCLSVDPLAPSNYYFVQEVDDKYSIRIKLYGARIGNSGVVRISKKQQESNPLQPGLCVIGEFEKRDKFTYKGGKRTQIPGKEVWLKEYVITP